MPLARVLPNRRDLYGDSADLYLEMEVVCRAEKVACYAVRKVVYCEEREVCN